MILSTLDGVTALDFASQTGWTPTVEGLCQGDVCVPASGSMRIDGTIDVEVAAARLGMPMVRDDVHGLAALGPATLNGTALTTAWAADPELITRQGESFRLSSLRGRKVLLVAWSSY
jgi:hypothetical protein